MNPFYYGVMRYNGKEYPHKYQPIIENRLFDKVQFLNEDKVDVIDKRLVTLYEDRLDGRITTPDYDKYVTRYKAEKEELAQNARSIFQSSQPAQKNKILKALLANAQIDQKRLQLNLLKPFSALVLATKSSAWLRRLDSNQ